MITQLRLRNFKSFREANLSLGPFNLFIGTNGSGKSNLFEAFRFLQGIGWDLSIEEILNGRPRTGSGSEWEGLRGGNTFTGTRRTQSTAAGEGTTELEVVTEPRSYHDRQQHAFDYRIGIDAKLCTVRHESLSQQWKTTAPADQSRTGQITVAARDEKEEPVTTAFSDRRPILTQITTNTRVSLLGRLESLLVSESFKNMQSIDPQPHQLREYSTSHDANRMGERGENFAALIQEIQKDATLAEGYLGWLREPRPAEVEAVEVLKGALGEPLFGLVEQGRTFPAPVLSDGTLRFAAMAAAFFQPSMPEILMFEEIENGMHPGRLRLLLELMKSRAGATGTQVLSTTHSALMLDWLEPEDYPHVFLCSRDPDGETTISPLSEIPHFLESVTTTPASQLITEGWMEMAL